MRHEQDRRLEDGRACDRRHVAAVDKRGGHSGSAGAILARRLAERGASVLLIEAGPEYPTGSVPEELRFLYGLAGAGHPDPGAVLWDLLGPVCTTGISGRG